MFELRDRRKGDMLFSWFETLPGLLFIREKRIVPTGESICNEDDTPDKADGVDGWFCKGAVVGDLFGSFQPGQVGQVLYEWFVMGTEE